LATINQATTSNPPNLETTTENPNNIIENFEENPFYIPQPNSPNTNQPQMAALRDHNIPNPGDTASPINYGPILPNNFEIHPLN